jgi:DNA helicase HerA-like ATPase
MVDSRPTYLFEGDRLMGTVVEVGPDHVRANLPLAGAQEAQIRHGERIGAGEVGEFVVIEAGDLAVFGRVTEIKLPESERLSVEPRMGRSADAHPIGKIQLLTTIPTNGEAPKRGIARFPRVGARVYSVEPSLITWIADHAGASDGGGALRLDLAYLPGSTTATVRITPERLFGRHCAVLGATGGGKSWTIARIIERCSEFDAKVILFDATGEYHRLQRRVRHVSLGEVTDKPDACENVVLPYRELEENDLFAILRPSIQAQMPKLREAVRSLKLAELVGDGAGLVDQGCIPKVGREKANFEAAYAKYVATVDSPSANFDITKLPRQIALECVYPSGWGQAKGERDFTKWGDDNQADYSYCASLIGRVESYLGAAEFAPVFQPEGKRSLLSEIDAFLESRDESVLRISLRNLSFKQDIREIVANGIARYLLAHARQGRFLNRPLVVCLDEAHQFLNKWLGDEYSKYPLDAFELVAKEGRKYSLSICIATQRPRDIPDGVLGQMGTLLVHRLTNDRDREAVERAAGDIDRSVVAFLPSLAQGQALLLGIDYPIPLIIQISPPGEKPDSSGPDYQTHWRRRENAPPDENEAPAA